MKTNSKINVIKTKTYIEQKLDKISLEKLSKESEFCKRKAKKITPKEFLIGFFMMIFGSDENTYRNWASKIGILIGDTISKQALWKRMQEAQVVFLQSVLGAILRESLANKIDKKITEKLKQFKNVLIEDSTHIKLNEKLWEEYPGNVNKDEEAKKAILKIQATYNITKNRVARFDITNFRKNDQGYSKKILETAKQGELIIKDLGYFVLRVFRKLNEEGIYFISRMRKRINIFSKENERPIDLAKMLRKRGKLDMEVLIGEKEKLPIRLIAIPVEEAVAAERRRKAKSNRDRRLNPNKEHLFLLGWELFITNVDKERLDTNDIAQIYFLRWRIEIIFKCWKSHFKIIKTPKDANKVRVESYIYCMLIFILLFQVSFYNYCLKVISNKSPLAEKNGISMMRLMQFLSSNINILFLNNLGNIDWEYLLEKQICYYCIYDSRRDRINYYQKIQKLS